MAKFTGRESLHLAAGMCGWDVRSGESFDVFSLSVHRWIHVKYDRMGRIVTALDHAQIGDGGPSIEQSLKPGSNRADQVIEWLSRLR